jgi:phosphatidylinositol alpha-1,6-mannosyltransferase
MFVGYHPKPYGPDGKSIPVLTCSHHKVVLVSSGLSNRFGGIGVVSEAIRTALALDHNVTLWRHPAGLPRPLRVAALGAQAFLGSLRRPKFVFYEHVHLASLHRKVPGLANVPYGIFMHGFELWMTLAGERREALMSARILISNSETTVRLTREKNPWLPRAEVTWPGIPPQAQGIRAGELPPNVCIVGRVARGELKGHDLIFDTWPRIRESVPNAKLYVIGSGDDEQRLRGRAEKIGGIEFLGRVSDTRRDEVFRSSRVFLFPSTQEGFGLAAVEAAGWGVPVVGVAGTVLEELFPSGGVEFVPELRTNLIADATIRLLTDDDRATRMGQCGRTRVQEFYQEEQFIRRFRETLAPVLQ